MDDVHEKVPLQTEMLSLESSYYPIVAKLIHQTSLTLILSRKSDSAFREFEAGPNNFEVDVQWLSIHRSCEVFIFVDQGWLTKLFNKIFIYVTGSWHIRILLPFVEF